VNLPPSLLQTNAQNAERNARLAAAAALDRLRQADVVDEAKQHWIIPPLS
jgi:hypothetical protein